MSRTHRTVIGVMGGAEVDPATLAMARQVGRLVAERGAVLLTGGRGGVMQAASEGARDAGGLTIGVLPGRDATETPPNPAVEVALFTGLGDGRNYVNVCSSDAVIALGGGWGTLSEIALAKKVGRRVIVLGDTMALPPEIERATTPEEAVALALQK